MAGLGWERLAAAETKKILDDYPNRVGAPPSISVLYLGGPI